MPIQLNYDNVRDLAKRLRDLAGREIKHTDIIAAIAGSLGRRPDAMMHELKHESASADAAKAPKADRGTPEEQSIRYAHSHDFDVWETGGGCLAFGRSLKSVTLPNGDAAGIQILITGEDGASISAGPNDVYWTVGLDYLDPRGGETIYSADTPMKLSEAIAVAAEFALKADKVWVENFDEQAIFDYIGHTPAAVPAR